ERNFRHCCRALPCNDRFIRVHVGLHPEKGLFPIAALGTVIRWVLAGTRRGFVRERPTGQTAFTVPAEVSSVRPTGVTRSPSLEIGKAAVLVDTSILRPVRLSRVVKGFSRRPRGDINSPADNDSGESGRPNG